jgi:hypothetical protein
LAVNVLLKTHACRLQAMCVSVAAASMRAMLLTKLISGLTQKKNGKKGIQKITKIYRTELSIRKREYVVILLNY